MVRCAVLGCLHLHHTFYNLFLHVVVSLTVMFAVPQLGFTMLLSWVTLVHMVSTIA